MAGDTTTSGSGVDSGEDDANLNLKVETRSVEVGLIASDKRGKPVTDLKRSELELYDNGRKQELIAFYHEAAATTGSPASAAEQSEQANGIFSNTASSAAQLRNAPDLLILLLDESHLAYATSIAPAPRSSISWPDPGRPRGSRSMPSMSAAFASFRT